MDKEEGGDEEMQTESVFSSMPRLKKEVTSAFNVPRAALQRDVPVELGVELRGSEVERFGEDAIEKNVR